MLIEHPPLSVVVADRLRARIESGALAPGARLNERALCQQLNVSRTPLREAYRILASEGLVELLPKRGARVVQLSATDVADIFDVLSVVEGLSGRLAAEKATREDLDELERLLAEMVAAHRAGDMLRYSLASKATHVAINTFARNPVLRGIYLRLNAQVQNLRYRSNRDPDNWARSVGDHEAFVEALLARDGELVERLLREHLVAKKNFAVSSGAPEGGSGNGAGSDAMACARASQARQAIPGHSLACKRDREEK